MITKFYLENFKSFNQQICADLRDLVVTAGSNSCGKSTLIQGLLLLAQTLEKPNRGIVLDFGGRYVQFAEFRDAVYGRPKMDKATFMAGFDVDTDGIEIDSIDSAMIFRNIIERNQRTVINDPNRGRLSPNPLSQNFQVRINFTASRLGESRVGIAEYKRIIGNFVEINYQIDRYKTNYRGTYSVKALKPIDQTCVGEDLLHEIDQLIHDFEAGSEKEKPSTINEKNIRPYRTDLNSSRRFRERYQVITAIFNTFGIAIEDIPDIGKELLKRIRLLIEIMPLDREIMELSKYFDKVLKFVFYKGLTITHIVSAEFDHFLLMNTQTNKFDPINGRPFSYFEGNFSEANREIVRFLRTIQYIGPLRAKPERAYLSLGTPIGIGVSGENAVPVLWLNQNEKITYKTKMNNEVCTKKLAVGVKEWLAEFGIASTFHITKPKQVIYQAELESSPGSGVMVTIADVGFGVSQLLPVIIAGLKAPRGTTLILEQPEIHLHPRLQGKLADFLICLVELDKKIIVETHSEHLINMLRLRIIQDKTGKLKDRIRILFVKRYEQISKNQTEKEGILEGSYIENLQVDDYGKIINWPPDFFPESSDLNEAILKAMMEKFEQGERGA